MIAHKFLLAASLCATTALAQSSGIQPENMDRSVKPGDNFYLFANGAWMKRTEIPADRTSVGSFTIVADKTDAQMKAIFSDLVAHPAAPGTEQRMVADLYASFMNTEAIEKNGLASIKPELAAIDAITTRTQLATALGSTLRADVDPLNNTNFHTQNLFGIWVAPGFNDPGKNAPYLLAGGATLPGRDYYLADSEHMKDVRAEYLKHIATMFRLAGISNADIRAERVMVLETKLSQVQISLADSEDIHKANNLWTADDFKTKAPGLDWDAYFSAAGLTAQKSFYVWQPSAFSGASSLVASQPLESWKDLLTLHLLEERSIGLSQAFAEERFHFFGTVLSGAPQQRPRDQRGIALANGMLGDAVGQIYVARYFSPESKQRAEAMVANLLAAYHKRLESLDWMSPSTKQEALRKLGTLHVSVGYPDKWRSYNGLEIKPDELASNLAHTSLFDYRYQLSRIGTPVDRSEWCMEPQTVNAVNLPLDNALNFPAAILQPPFFDANASDAANYGAIGTVIGHEISHTFDSEGAAFDSEGKVRDWWTPADYEHFKQATAALAAQYDAYEPFPGVHVNGRQTLGENIADLGGVAASLDAFHAATAGKQVAAVDGFNADQQFFLAFAQIWRTKTREASYRARIVGDPHAPGEFRAEIVRNFDLWYKSFNVQPGQTMYLPPDKRVRIW